MRFLPLFLALAMQLWGAQAAWIWDESPQDHEKLAFRTSFEVNDVLAATVMASCDNSMTLWINGKLAGKSQAWQEPLLVKDAREFLRPGKNMIAVAAENEEGMAGMALVMDIATKTGNIRVATGEDWEYSENPGTNWFQKWQAGGDWKPATKVVELGGGPYGNVLQGAHEMPEDQTPSFAVAPGFKLEKLMTVPDQYGSWVTITTCDDGHFIACNQYGKLYHIWPSPLGHPEQPTVVREIEVPIGGAHGLLWHKGELFVSVGENVAGYKQGVYRVRDTDGDGELDEVTQYKLFNGGGEHGPHSLISSPDGEWIYYVCGNHTDLAEIDFSWAPTHWGEDQLIKRNNDANGHANGRMAPGGFIIRFKPDNSRWELVSMGYRNQFDAAFDTEGELITYDADMEWDFGMPWYRPTRICHAVPGSEFGWRLGTGKWPEYSEDSMGPMLNIGPGSPTGVLSGKGGKFPAKYQRAIFAFDWTFATIYAIHIQRDGENYTATKEEFVSGKGWPLTDGTMGKDGSIYLLTGGRRTRADFWRITYTGAESTEPVSYATHESRHFLKDKLPTAQLWKQLASKDRTTRNVARAIIERRNVDEWRSQFNAETDPQGIITGGIALARSGAGADRELIFNKLQSLAWDKLDKNQRLGLMRAYGLVAIRLGGFTDEQRQKLLGGFDALFPNGDRELDRELCRLLSYLQSPTIVAKALEEMAANRTEPTPDWAELATRNDSYGKDINGMLVDLPSAQNLHYAYCIRVVKGPWTEGQRKQFFTWLNKESLKNGGNSYKGFIKQMRDDALETATPEERKLVAAMPMPKPPNPMENLPQPKGPGKPYTVQDVVAAVQSGLTGRDKENGQKMFQAVMCGLCHRFEGVGGGSGPDLSNVGGRFSAEDLAVAILDPSQEVSDQYQFSLIKMKDGSSLTGRILQETNGVLTVANNAFDFSMTETVERADIESVSPSQVSPMPGGLINRLNAEELKDLLAFLLKKD